MLTKQIFIDLDSGLKCVIKRDLALKRLRNTGIDDFSTRPFFCAESSMQPKKADYKIYFSTILYYFEHITQEANNSGFLRLPKRLSQFFRQHKL